MARFTGPTSASSSKLEDQSDDCAAPHDENSGEKQSGMLADGRWLKALNRHVSRSIIGSHVLNALVSFVGEAVANGDIVFAVDLDSELLG
jgi:hypothetical protein